MDKLIIDWSHIPTYTTIMGICAGSSLISISSVGKKLLRKELNPAGWSLNFAALGSVLLVTGAHMALTWPLAIPFDNIVFGETSFALGVLNLVLAFYLWKRGAAFNDPDSVPIHIVSKELSPFRTVLVGLGLGIISIGCAALQFRFFIAPPQEPIGGDVASTFPVAENVVISSIFLCVGLAALLTTIFLTDYSEGKGVVRWYHKANYVLLQVTGCFFLISGAIVYYTHIGLIIHTMK